MQGVSGGIAAVPLPQASCRSRHITGAQRRLLEPLGPLTKNTLRAMKSRNARRCLRRRNGGGGPAGWYLLGMLVIASVLYVRANSLGRKLLVSSSSSLMLSIDEPNRLQANTGASVVRVLVLLSSYPLVLCI